MEEVRNHKRALEGSLVSRHGMEVLNTAIKTADLEDVLRRNRNQLYRNPEVDENGLMRYPEMPEEDTDGTSDTSFHVGDQVQYHEHHQAHSNGLAKALIPLMAATILGGSALGVAWMLDNDKPTAPVVEPKDKDTNTIVRIE